MDVHEAARVGAAHRAGTPVRRRRAHRGLLKGPVPEQLAETLAEHDRLTFVANQVPVPAKRESARIAVRPNKAADAYDAALARYRTVLDAQTLVLTGLYQAACVRFALAAAVVEACDCGDDCAWLPDDGRALAAEATAPGPCLGVRAVRGPPHAHPDRSRAPGPRSVTFFFALPGPDGKKLERCLGG